MMNTTLSFSPKWILCYQKYAGKLLFLLVSALVNGSLAIWNMVYPISFSAIGDPVSPLLPDDDPGGGGPW